MKCTLFLVLLLFLCEVKAADNKNINASLCKNLPPLEKLSDMIVYSEEGERKDIVESYINAVSDGVKITVDGKCVSTKELSKSSDDFLDGISRECSSRCELKASMLQRKSKIDNFDKITGKCKDACVLLADQGRLFIKGYQEAQTLCEQSIEAARRSVCTRDGTGPVGGKK